MTDNKIEVKFREYDKRWVVWEYMIDPCYDPNEMDESSIPYISSRWIMTGVFRDEKDAKKYKDERIRKSA